MEGTYTHLIEQAISNPSNALKRGERYGVEVLNLYGGVYTIWSVKLVMGVDSESKDILILKDKEDHIITKVSTRQVTAIVRAGDGNSQQIYERFT